MCSKSKNTNRRPQMNTNFHFSPANNKYTNNTQIKNSQKAIEMKKKVEITKSSSKRKFPFYINKNIVLKYNTRKSVSPVLA
jgi:hypothetical protein